MGKRIKCCHTCDHCVYIGEGDYICDKGSPFIVMEDHCPSVNYCACNNPRLFKEAQQLTDELNDTELNDTQDNKKNVKEVNEMNKKCNEVRKHIFEEMLKVKDDALSLREFLGTAICDGGCPRFKEGCIATCKLCKAIEDYISETDAYSKKVAYDRLKSVVGCFVHENLKGGA